MYDIHFKFNGGLNGCISKSAVLCYGLVLGGLKMVTLLCLELSYNNNVTPVVL